MPDQHPIPHRCRRGPHCFERKRLDDNQIYGAPIPAADGLCPACHRHVESALLRELVTDYVELDMALGHTGNAGGPLVSGTRELPVPIQLVVEATQAKMVDTATCWAESVAEVLRVGWDTQEIGRTRPGVRLQRATHLLADSLPVLLALRDVTHLVWTDDGQLTAVDRDGLDGAIALLDLHRRARSVLGCTRHVNRLRTPCPACKRQALKHADGNDIVTCAACGEWWTWDEYQDLADPIAAGVAA